MMSGKKKGYVPYMALRRAELEQLARESFDFLVREKYFASPTTERDVMWTSYYYADPRTSIAMQVQLDFRDDTVRVNLVRLREGKLPPGGFVDMSTGERIRAGFLGLLKDILHVTDTRLDEMFDVLYTAPSPDQPRDYQWAEATVARWRFLVERYIDLVARQPIDVLFPPPPPGASAASQA